MLFFSRDCFFHWRWHLLLQRELTPNYLLNIDWNLHKFCASRPSSLVWRHHTHTSGDGHRLWSACIKRRWACRTQRPSLWIFPFGRCFINFWVSRFFCLYLEIPYLQYLALSYNLWIWDRWDLIYTACLGDRSIFFVFFSISILY